MLIFPAIDIIGGQCVRLTQGDFDRGKIYCKDPVIAAKKFEREGATFLHVVDLEGAKAGRPVNFETIAGIKENTGLSVQVGGGIRKMSDADKLFDLGIDRIVLGTSAIKDREFLGCMLKKYSASKIIVSIDAKDEKVLIDGWLKDSGKSLFGILDELKSFGVKTIIFTDVKSDGFLNGPNFEAIKRVAASGLNVIVAGGVSSIDDLRKLREIEVYGVIIGKALYEGLIDLSFATAKFQKNNLAKRIIPCMDIKDGRVVKGTCFRDLKDGGDPVELAKKYSETGADELVFLDITATIEGRKTLCALVRRIAENINIPFTVGGGIGSTLDISNLLNSGADKVSIGSAAFKNPDLVMEAAKAFGSQCIVISVDAKRSGAGWNVFIDGGRRNTGLDAIDFAKEMERLGAGELLINSLDRDGTYAGYDIELLKKISAAINVPVIASSGAGKKSDFLQAFKEADVDAVLAASVFHYGEIEIPKLKKYLQRNNVTIRL